MLDNTLLDTEPNFVFISHDASLTGAPIMLLNFLKVLKRNGFQNILIILHRGGDLQNEFSMIYPCIILKGRNYGKRKNVFLRVIDFIIYRIKVFFIKIKIRNYNYIISNTLANGRLLKMMSNLKIPILTYVHELNSVISLLDTNNDAKLSFEHSKILIYPSEIVKDYLVNKRNIELHKLRNLKYCFSISNRSNPQSKSRKRKEISNKYNVNEEYLWVVGYGTGNKRKGVDLFVEVANLVLKQTDNICFFWLGDFTDKQLESYINQKIIEYGISSRCIFIGSMPWDIYNLQPFDLFVLPSREDPYPLVVIEAGFNQIPSIAFKDGGGITDFLREDAGWIVNDFSIAGMAKVIYNLSLDRQKILEKGQIANDRAMAWHFNEKDVVLSFKSIINSL